MPDQPNPVAVGVSVLRSRRVRRPDPQGTETVDHAPLAEILGAVASSGPRALGELRPDIDAYVDTLAAVDPDDLDLTGAQAYWLNLYNAGALGVASQAYVEGSPTVLRIPGAFSRPWVEIAGEGLSLDDIEHGKVRRFRDPRIHAALVCGSASCPTLRYEPYRGDSLDAQLDSQMRSFVTSGAVVLGEEATKVSMSRIFLWYGRDFTHPHLMPGIGTSDASLVRDTVAYWLPPDERRQVWANAPDVEFQDYDWGLSCTVA